MLLSHVFLRRALCELKNEATRVDALAEGRKVEQTLSVGVCTALNRIRAGLEGCVG